MNYKRLTIRVSKETHKEVQALCEHFKESQSTLFRRLVTERYSKLKQFSHMQDDPAE